jgi:hypothetical protein
MLAAPKPLLSSKNLQVFIGPELPDNPSYSVEAYLERGPVPAGGKRYFVIDQLQNRFGFPNTLTGFQVEDIEGGSLKFFVFGYIKYTDDFSIFGSRAVGYCGVYNPGAAVIRSGRQ